MDAFSMFKKEHIVGLDIGTSSVKIAQFTRKEDGLCLVKADLKEIMQTGDETVREKEIVSALKDLLRGIDIKKSKIIVSINCPKTAVKITKVPYMPKAELHNGISLEAQNYFPFPIDNSLVDHEILTDVVEKGVRKYKVALGVSPKVTVDRYLSLLKKAGIKPASFIPCPYALHKLGEQSYSQKDKTTCFIDIGQLHTELVILKGYTLVFTRKIPVTAIDFTKALMGVLVSDIGKTELSLDEAEKIKKEIGIPLEGEPKIIDNKISTPQILSMLRVPLEQLVNEIDRCFDYYREEAGGENVDSIVLFGGSASLTGLIEYLSEGLGIKVKLGDPLEGLKINKDGIKEREKISHRLGFAIGAALNGGKGINLLPAEIKEETKRVIKRSTAEVIATAIILVSAFFYIGMRIQLGNFHKRISVARLEFSSLQPQLKQAKAHQLANLVLVDEPHWEDIFKELSNIIPVDIHLTNMTFENNVIGMRGIVASQDGEELISDFILALEKGIFKSVKLRGAKDLPEKAGNEFELECRLD